MNLCDADRRYHPATLPITTVGIETISITEGTRVVAAHMADTELTQLGVGDFRLICHKLIASKRSKALLD